MQKIKILLFEYRKQFSLFLKTSPQISSSQIFILSLHDLQDLFPNFRWSYFLTATTSQKIRGGWQIIFYG